MIQDHLPVPRMRCACGAHRDFGCGGMYESQDGLAAVSAHPMYLRLTRRGTSSRMGLGRQLRTLGPDGGRLLGPGLCDDWGAGAPAPSSSGSPTAFPYERLPRPDHPVPRLSSQGRRSARDPPVATGRGAPGTPLPGAPSARAPLHPSGIPRAASRSEEHQGLPDGRPLDPAFRREPGPVGDFDNQSRHRRPRDVGLGQLRCGIGKYTADRLRDDIWAGAISSTTCTRSFREDFVMEARIAERIPPPAGRWGQARLDGEVDRGPTPSTS